MTEARIYRTPRGTFRLLEPEALQFRKLLARAHWTALDLSSGALHDFSTEADAVSWMETGEPKPLPKPDFTPEEIAEFEQAEAEFPEDDQ